jgi:soluble lytic murein transglycosylase-like protein
MKLKKIYIILSFVLTVSTALLMSTVVDLSNQKKENQGKISRLTQKIAQLEKKVNHFEAEKDQFDYYKFKQNVFNLKYPDYAQIAKIVFQKSKNYGFNPYLVMAMIQVESNFDQFAVSNAGAYGLMQVNYSVWKDELKINFNRIFEKGYNIELGLTILKHYYEENPGNLFMALFRYNNGYKYDNKEYNGKIIATKFYSHGKKAPPPESKDKELAI